MLPPQPYVPGRTARPADGHFDGIRDSAQPGMTIADLAQSRAFTTGLAYMEAGYFWEAHEVLEPVWMACPQNSAEQILVRALIQWANAELKARMQQPKAAARLRSIALDLLAEAQSRGGPVLMGQDMSQWHQRMNSAI